MIGFGCRNGWGELPHNIKTDDRHRLTDFIKMLAFFGHETLNWLYADGVSERTKSTK
jgi:hypothetical protein